jgi:DNA-directed RNA polymerase subunit M/transcription elongation factor TFIIS
MPFVWLVECKTCLQRFAVLPREVAPKGSDTESTKTESATISGGARAKSTSTLPSGENAGTFECPHCHEEHPYMSEDLIPGEGRIIHK